MKLINTEEINYCRYCDTPNGNSTDDKSGELFCLFLHYWKSSSLLYCMASYSSICKAPLVAKQLRSDASAQGPSIRNRFWEQQEREHKAQLIIAIIVIIIMANFCNVGKLEHMW